MQILRAIKHYKKVLSKLSINHYRSSACLRSIPVSSLFSHSLSPCSSPSLSSSLSSSFSQYSIFSQLPVHLKRSVHSNDDILHWQSSPNKARLQLQVMSSNMDSRTGLCSIQTKFPYYLASHVGLENATRSWCSKLASKQPIGSWLISHVAVTHLL